METEQHTANDLWVTEKMSEEIKNFLESSENQNTTYQYLWDTGKDVLRGKYTAISAYI
jgi:hypothetical protein